MDLFSPTTDKENLDRSDMSLSAGLESPTVKLVCMCMLCVVGHARFHPVGASSMNVLSTPTYPSRPL